LKPRGAATTPQRAGTRWRTGWPAPSSRATPRVPTQATSGDPVGRAGRRRRPRAIGRATQPTRIPARALRGRVDRRPLGAGVLPSGTEVPTGRPRSRTGNRPGRSRPPQPVVAATVRPGRTASRSVRPSHRLPGRGVAAARGEGSPPRLRAAAPSGRHWGVPWGLRSGAVAVLRRRQRRRPGAAARPLHRRRPCPIRTAAPMRVFAEGLSGDRAGPRLPMAPYLPNASSNTRSDFAKSSRFTN
jgi:hypothetical protein